MKGNGYSTERKALSANLFRMFALLLMLSFMFSAPPAKAADMATYRIVIIPKIMGIQYYAAVKQGIDKAASELPVEVEWIGPAMASVEGQIDIIEQAIPRKPDLIAVSANDPRAISPALRKAAESGIRIMSWDADTDFREFFVNLVDYDTFGEKLATSMHEQVGDTADIAVITTTFTALNQVRWLKAIKNTICDRYSGLSILDIRPAGESTETALRIARDYIIAFPNLRGIIALGAPNLPGAAEAVKQAGLSKKIAIVGTSTPNQIRAYLKKGVIQEVFLWNAPDHGYLTVYCAYRLLEGDIAPGVAFEAGDLGMVTPLEDDISMQVSLPIEVFTAENVDEYDF